MLGKIALEEHFAMSETVHFSTEYAAEEHKAELSSCLLDLEDGRLRQMDENGVEMMLLSLNAPSVQASWAPDQAKDLARRANDYLAEHVNKHPTRLQGLAALPLQDPEAAAEELKRCVQQLGFRGALANGFSEVAGSGILLYYDLPQYRSFWQVVEALDVPFYLHPRNPLAKDAAIYEGHDWLMGPIWAFAQETAVHSLRLMGSGLFDDYPNLKIIIGHMGEGLPFSMWRVDNANAWLQGPPRHRAKRKIGDYFQENFYLTTSGNFHTPLLITSMLEVGSDRILFSTDWPFELVDSAARWFDTCTISELDRAKIGRHNAVELFGLHDVLGTGSAVS
jgi:predicted TIM-barrel fold metal-dependent hydrolase